MKRKWYNKRQVEQKTNISKQHQQGTVTPHHRMFDWAGHREDEGGGELIPYSRHIPPAVH